MGSTSVVRNPVGRTAAAQLLLSAANPTSGNAELVAATERVDPTELVALVEYHRVAPLVYQRLMAIEGIRTDLREALAPADARSQIRRLHAQRTLRALEDALTTPFLVVKGLVLATHWYSDPVSREFNDVDILVRRVDFRTALEAASGADFASLATNWHGFLDHGVAEVPLGFESSVVDLHWNLVALGRQRADIRLSTDEVFERAMAVEIADRRVLTLDAVDTLIHLCVNVGLDGARRLRGLVDIDAVVRSDRIDFVDFVDRARRVGSDRISAAVLQRVATFLDTRIPSGVLEELSRSPAWLWINRTIDRGGTAARFDRGIASGVVLSSGRQSWSSTVRTLATTASHAVTGRAGHGMAGLRGELNWNRTPDDGAVEVHRQRYLEYVDARVRPLHRTRCVDVDGLHRRIGSLQPRTTPMLASAFMDGLTRRGTRADLWFVDDGTLAAAVVRSRWTIGRTTAYPLLLDTSASAPVGRFLDRSSVTGVEGLVRDTESLRPHMSRWRNVGQMTQAWLPPGFEWESPPDGIRTATRADLDDLVEMFWNHSPHTYPNQMLLRRQLRRAIDQIVLVLEVGTPPKAAGYGLLDGFTPEYDHWAHLVIAPEFRRQGLSWQLVAAGAAHTSGRGAGGLVFVVDSNPMSLPADSVDPERWNSVRLALPRRFRGERRIRRLLDTALTWGDRPSGASAPRPNFRQTNSDERMTGRRTQRWWHQIGREGDS